MQEAKEIMARVIIFFRSGQLGGPWESSGGRGIRTTLSTSLEMLSGDLACSWLILRFAAMAKFVVPGEQSDDVS